jgi:hypothetical protein
MITKYIKIHLMKKKLLYIKKTFFMHRNEKKNYLKAKQIFIINDLNIFNEKITRKYRFHIQNSI